MCYLNLKINYLYSSQVIEVNNVMTFVHPASETDALKAKRSEVRLTCDLLMKQVYDLKVAATQEDGPNMQVPVLPSLYHHYLRYCVVNLVLLLPVERVPSLSPVYPSLLTILHHEYSAIITC